MNTTENPNVLRNTSTTTAGACLDSRYRNCHKNHDLPITVGISLAIRSKLDAVLDAGSLTRVLPQPASITSAFCDDDSFRRAKLCPSCDGMATHPRTPSCRNRAPEPTKTSQST